ncbi:MAG: septum formation initiator [Magnetovibrio sp.]|nr:septum formation initiator [Magnetovibrio sp.]
MVYFTYHILHGERGLLSWWQLQKRVLKAETAVRITSTQKNSLEKKVKLLTPSSLDLDMLEERARVMLNYGYPEDVVVLDPEGN